MSDYRAALMAYPPSYRRENGSEMTDTANELTGERWSIKQSASLVVGGLINRSRHATGGSSRKVWEAGARVGLLVWLVTVFGRGFAVVAETAVDEYASGAWTLERLLPLAAILAMMVSTRWWVALLVTAIWVQPLWDYATSPVIHTPSYVQIALPLAGAVVVAWWLAVATDGRRAVHPAVGISLLIATTLAWVASNWMMTVVLVVLVVGGLLASLVDPRAAATAAVYASLFLPVGALSAIHTDYKAFFFVVGIASAITAAASQLGMKRLART